MPLGFERLNERSTRPNALINFIKPLPGPEAAIAEEFLSRIAAQCYPVMKSNYIAVMALEEYEFNTEFIGRNFNAGEVIQLVLKARDGSWLPFRHVQMVMMHELAHCKQMNHSRAFWAVRNGFAGEMKELWGRGYTGEGLWGRGRNVDSGRFVHNSMPDQSLLPEHVCGGTFRSGGRGRKRKRGSGKEKPSLSYAERQQKRILKKFGAGGVSLGDDEDARVKLESGKSAKGKPRVANSKRGRELRAAAALARFKQIQQPTPVKKDEDDEDSETESDYDSPALRGKIQTNLTCRSLHNPNGLGFVKVCEDEEKDDVDAMRERLEMLEVSDSQGPVMTNSRQPRIKQEQIDNDDRRWNMGDTETEDAEQDPIIKSEVMDDNEDTDSDTTEGNQAIASLPTSSLKTQPPRTNAKDPTNLTATKPSNPPTKSNHPNSIPNLTQNQLNLQNPQPPQKTPKTNSTSTPQEIECSACTMNNPPNTPTCQACNNVLEPEKMLNAWRCESEICRGSYMNIGDYGRCFVCGGLKKKPS